MTSGPITSFQTEVGKWKQQYIFFSWFPKSLQTMTAAMELKHFLLGTKAVANQYSILKKQRCHFANKGPYRQSYGFSSSHVWMWELDHTDGWALKNLCFRTVVLEKTLKSLLDSKVVKPVNPKGNQHSVFIRRTAGEGEAPIFWPPDVKSWLIGKNPDSEKH